MKFLPFILSLILLSGCASWSTSSVKKPSTGTSSPAGQPISTAPAVKDIVVTEKDITSRRYEVLGDIEVTVNKTTIFHKDPTREMVDEELQKKAAEMSADAVILVRYGTVGISFLSWGSLEGKGRAVRFLR